MSALQAGTRKPHLGWLDANILVHALVANDPHRDRCRRILAELQEGRTEARIDPLTIHEASYALFKVLPDKFPTPGEVAEYLTSILLIDAIQCPDKEELLAALERWAEKGPKWGGFVDAWLAVRARRSGLPVCSVNGSDFPDVANTYPS